MVSLCHKALPSIVAVRPRRRPFSRHISKIECIEIALFTREGALERLSAVRDHTLSYTRPWITSSSTMAVNPNFFPNGYQDPMHPEDEVVSNWVRALTHPNTFFFNILTGTLRESIFVWW